MSVELINISQKSSAIGTLKRLPADRTINLKEENVEKPVKEPDSSRVKALVADLQSQLNNTDLHFSVDEPSGRIMITVTEKSSGKVIREIPSSEILHLAANMDAMIGMIFNKNG